MRFGELDWSAVAAETNCGSEKCCGDYKPDPKTRAAQVSSRSELCQRINRGVVAALEIEGARPESHQTVFHKGGEIRSAERDFFEDLDRDKWQHGPKKCRSSRPARDQQQPAVDRRMPERDRGQAVEQHQPVLKHGD